MSQTLQDYTKKTVVDIDAKGCKKEKFDSVVDQVYWSKRQRQIWVGSLFLGAVMLYVTRVAGPVTVVAMGQDLGWDKTVAVSISQNFCGLFNFKLLLWFNEIRFVSTTCVKIN